MKPIQVLLPLLGAISLLLAACGGGATGSDSAPAPQTITVQMNDIYYGETNDNVQNPPVWTVTAGAEVRVQFDNRGALEHNWTVLKAGEDIPLTFDAVQNDGIILLAAENVAGGTKAEFRFTAPTAGEYNVICTIAGHAALMQGRLVVTG